MPASALYGPSEVGSSGKVNRFRIDWTSDGSGNASVSVPALNGTILRVIFKPGSGGSQPTNGYNAVLTEAGSGIDLLRGLGTGLSNSTATSFCPCIDVSDGTNLSTTNIAVADDVTLTISGAGAKKFGTVDILVR